jgi:type IV pilus assembly protein PilN
MIRINLLPFRAARKIENIRRQITIYALVVVLTIVLLAYGFLQLNGKASGLRKKKQSVNTELATYQKTLTEIKKLEKTIKSVETKLAVIKRLEKGKSGPVLLLDAVANAVPKDKLWLTSLTESRGILNLSGTAMDNETVALFMDNLKASDQIVSVELENTKLRSFPRYKLNASDFRLRCVTAAYKKPTPKKGKKKK